MKRLFAFVAALLFIACNSDDVYTPTNKATRFHAIIEDASTRTFVDENIRLRWTAEDLITLFEGTTRNKKYKFLGETGDNAGDFEDITTGFGSGNDVNRYYALYPYASTTKLHEDGYITYTLPAEQTYAENSFGLGANPMVAVTEDKNDYDLSFKNVCGYLRLYLYGEDVTIKSITIEGNDSEPIAGKAIITPTYGGNPTIEMDATATTTVTLNCGEGVAVGSTAETSTPFWIVLPPTTFANGFTLTITDTNDNEFTKSISSNVNIQRNKYLSARIEVEFPKPVPNNQIWYTASSKISNISNIFGESHIKANISSHIYDDSSQQGIIIFDTPIVEIGDNAFYNNDYLLSLMLPNSVTTIGNSAFENSNLYYGIMMPNSVTQIGYRAFRASNISKINIGKGVKSIGDYAFAYCDKLYEIKIPDSVEDIGQWIIYESNVSRIHLGKGIKTLGYGWNSYGKLSSIYIYDLESYFNIVCEGDSFSSGNVFTPNNYLYLSGELVQDLIIPEGVIHLKESHFSNCASFTSITIPDSVENIDNGLLKGCTNINSIKGKYASPDSKCLIFNNILKSFAVNCKATEYTIPNNISTIGDYAFYYCRDITSITILENVTSIGEYAFAECSNLTNVYCNRLTPPTLGYNAFLNNASTRKIYVPTEAVEAYKAADGWKNYASKIVGYNF